MVVERGLKLTDLAALGMALSNTFGLSVGILLMGYGLVEIPRGMWKSDPQQLLKWSAHRCVQARLFGSSGVMLTRAIYRNVRLSEAP